MKRETDPQMQTTDRRVDHCGADAVKVNNHDTVKLKRVANGAGNHTTGDTGENMSQTATDWPVNMTS
ncbi:hypothetical protein TYRP_019379 [Tyrophagus putrescentiae]|nr:hypothetical protein TYRP_019379 [Tyrophagus putrescentiae]